MTDREKILIALREKPLKAFEIMKRVNIKHQDDCQSLLLKMRDDGAVKFDIHKGHWLAASRCSLGHQRLGELPSRFFQRRERLAASGRLFVSAKSSAMSGSGTFRTPRDVRLESGMRTEADVR